MKPEQFFESFVEGNFFDCCDAPGDIRRAFNAAVASSHFADHYYNFNKRYNPSVVLAFCYIGAFIEHLSMQTSGAFRDIRSISNAYKHLYTNIDRKNAANSSVNSSGSIDSIQISGNEDITNIEEEYSLAGTRKKNKCIVIFTRKDGTKSEFLPVLKTVVTFFRTMTYQSGA